MKETPGITGNLARPVFCQLSGIAFQVAEDFLKDSLSHGDAGNQIEHELCSFLVGQQFGLSDRLVKNLQVFRPLGQAPADGIFTDSKEF
ncbi:MAG: hypothetical protein ACOYM3_15735 [Terrimicrobiaceae bacterium]